MAIALITGSAGLIGSEAAIFFADLGLEVFGIENDMRKVFFGDEASTRQNLARVKKTLGDRYRNFENDIRDEEAVNRIFRECGKEIALVIHTAAQPSHDWAVREPLTDFSVNATGTLILLEATRKHCPEAAFVYTSTNKVYGDTPNRLPLQELESRWEIEPNHTYEAGIREDMSIDHTLHSLFGVSKAAADLAVQEYGRYFQLKTACFRGGCLTGPNHSGTELHGFLAYLMKCAVTGVPYTIYGYKGKQVRDNIHCADLINCFHQFFLKPRVGEVYNIGGGRSSNVSMLEAIDLCKEITGRPLNWTYNPDNRVGDHMWWISDSGKFAAHFPNWRQSYGIEAILREIYEENFDKWTKGAQT